MIEPQVEHGGASSWFWIVEWWLVADGEADATGVAAGAAAIAGAGATASSSRPLTLLLPGCPTHHAKREATWMISENPTMRS